VTGPTAASTPAKLQGRGSRIPVRHQLQEPHPSHKATQPIIDSRSIRSASVGYSSPRVPSSVGGASEHCSTSLNHPTTVTRQLPTGVGVTQQHHPTRVTVIPQHPPSGLTVTQQHHPIGATVTYSNTLLKTQYHSTMTQHPHLTVTQQHHPAGVMTTQVNATQANSVGHDDNRMSHDAFDDENSLNLTTGDLSVHKVKSCVVLICTVCICTVDVQMHT